jgi:hypothetical protein
MVYSFKKGEVNGMPLKEPTEALKIIDQKLEIMSQEIRQLRTLIRHATTEPINLDALVQEISAHLVSDEDPVDVLMKMRYGKEESQE